MFSSPRNRLLVFLCLLVSPLPSIVVVVILIIGRDVVGRIKAKRTFREQAEQLASGTRADLEGALRKRSGLSHVERGIAAHVLGRVCHVALSDITEGNRKPSFKRRLL